MRLLVLILLFLLPHQSGWAQNFTCDQAKFLLSDLRLGESYDEYFIRKGVNPNFTSQSAARIEMEGIMRGMFPGWLCSPEMIDVDTGGFDQLTCYFQFSENPGTEDEILKAAQIFQQNIPDFYNCLGDEIETSIPKSMFNESKGESMIAVLSTGKTSLSPKQVYRINVSNERLGLKLLDRSLKYSSNPTIEYGYLQQVPEKPVAMAITARYSINPDSSSSLDVKSDCSMPEQILSDIGEGNYSKILKNQNQSRAAHTIFKADTCTLSVNSSTSIYSCKYYKKNIVKVYDDVSKCFSYYEWRDRYDDDGFRVYSTRRNSKNVRLSVREKESSSRGDYVQLTFFARR